MMFSLLKDLIFNPILCNTFLAAIAGSITAGLLGPYIVSKKIASISGSIAHSILGGIGFVLWISHIFNIEYLHPLFGAILAAILTACIMSKIHLKYKEREDSLTTIIWSLGMALGVIFISQIPKGNLSLMDFFLGNILWIDSYDLFILFGLSFFILLFVLLFHNKFLTLCFDEKQVIISGFSPERIYRFLLILVALATVLLMYTMGILLVLNLFTLSPSIISRFSNKLSFIMAISIILNLLFCCLGIIVSYYLNWPVGPTIASLSGALYLFSLSFNRS